MVKYSLFNVYLILTLPYTWSMHGTLSNVR